jgi:peptidoglycan/LPS O-acetylase OafA/YrhL
VESAHLDRTADTAIVPAQYRPPVSAGRAAVERDKSDRHVRLAYAPGLDGVRALAVTAVVLYHLGTTGLHLGSHQLMRGGFIGVDVFFVLSGFLITSLLLAERATTGKISIRQFYVRRARRLLPALYTMMAVVAVAAAYGFTDYAARLRGDLLAAVTYVTNWWLIAGGSSYFGGGDHPPMLTHLWSLALEEQFYVLWPLALIALTFLRTRNSVLGWVGGAVLVSTLLAAVLYSPWQDPSRIYYGTDTRLATPLLGALLAIVFRPWLWRGNLSAGVRRLLNAGGVVAIAGLGIGTVVLDDQGALLYRGGFLVVAILAGVLVLAAAHPGAAIGRVLGVAPLRWLGERSYAIYLWHWPIFAVTRPGINNSLNVVLDTVLRVGLTLLAADLSYRFVETPMRRGALGKAIAAWRGSAGRARTAQSAKAASVALATLVAAVFVGGSLAGAAAPKDAPVGPGPDLSLGLLPGASAKPAVTPSHPGNPTPSAGKSTAKAPPLHQPGTPPHVAVFGDSQGMTLLINVPKDTGKYIDFTDDTIEGCGFLIGKVSSTSGEKRDLNNSCSKWESTWRSRAIKDKPDIALIMVGAWDVFDLTVGSTAMTFGTSAWDANYLAQLDKAIVAAHAGGSRVAISLLPCYRPVAANKGKGAGYWPERGDDSRTRHINDLLGTGASAHPDYVSTVDPPVQFCNDPKIASSLNYRWDGVHYYKPGALLYCQVVIPQLLALEPS